MPNISWTEGKNGGAFTTIGSDSYMLRRRAPGSRHFIILINGAEDGLYYMNRNAAQSAAETIIDERVKAYAKVAKSENNSIQVHGVVFARAVLDPDNNMIRQAYTADFDDNNMRACQPAGSDEWFFSVKMPAGLYCSQIGFPSPREALNNAFAVLRALRPNGRN